MALTREERRLLHQKSQQPTFGSGKPNSREGNDGDISFRKVEGSGTVQYLKEGGDWTAISSTGEMPAVRISGSSSGGGSSGVSHHASLSGLDSDDHVQYLLIDGTRAMTGDLSLGGGDGALTFTVAGENSIKIPDNQAIALIIEEANTAYLTFVTTNSGEKMQFHKALDIDAVSDFGSNAMTNVNIDSGAIDGTAIGANSHSTIKGTTIDATTDFTIDGLVITADTITNDAALTVDAAGDIILDANSGVTKFYLAGDTDDLCTLTVAANGVTTIATADSDGAVGHLILDADGDITLDPAGGDVYVKTASSVDPSIQFNSNSTDYWRMGVDTSDSNKFKIHGTTVTSLVNNSYFELGLTEDAGQGITLTGDGLQFNTDAEYLYATGGRMTIGNVALGLRVGPPVAFTSATGLAHGDEQTTYDSFGIRWKTLTGGTYNGQHIAGGEADYTNNYAMIGTSFVSTKYANHATDFVLTGG